MLTKYLLIEGESDKNSTDEDSEDGITYIVKTIAAKLLQLLQNNIDSLKRADIIKGALKKLKSFIVKDKKDATNEHDKKTVSLGRTSINDHQLIIFNYSF